MSYQAKLDAEREAEAKRKGMSLWAYDMSRATDDKLLSDIVRDNIRPGPTQDEIDEAIRKADAHQRYEVAFAANIPEVLRRAGYDPAIADENLFGWAERFLRETGGAVGPAVSKLMGLYPNRNGTGRR